MVEILCQQNLGIFRLLLPSSYLHDPRALIFEPPFSLHLSGVSAVPGEAVGDGKLHQAGLSIKVGPMGMKFFASVFPFPLRFGSNEIAMGASNRRKLLTR